MTASGHSIYTEQPALDPSAGYPSDCCERLLQPVSRTFALTIPQLPHELRRQVGCAYLFCRMVDTLEDYAPSDGELESAETALRDRQARFEQLRRLFATPLPQPSDVAAFANQWSHRAGDDPCLELLASAQVVFDRLAEFPRRSSEIIRHRVLEMISGLRRTLPSGSGDAPVVLFRTMHEGERYCHYAAGAVGQMLVGLFWVYLHRTDSGISRRMMHDAKRFGRGLQWTNIVKDHPADLRSGRCFIPAEAMTRTGYGADRLLQPLLPRGVKAYLAARAVAHLDRAMEFVTALPIGETGIRLFCIQPLMMAVLTLGVVVAGNDATPTDNLKISRAAVAEVLRRSHQEVHSNDRLRSWYEEERRRGGDVIGAARGDSP